MRKIINLWMIALLLLTGCSKDDGDSNAVVLTTTSIELYSVVNNTNQVTITTTDRWTATCNAQWVTFSPKSGEAGTHTITISTTETNRTKALRTAQLEISASSTRKSITIKQRDDYAIFDKKNINVPAEGATLKDITFKTNLEQDQLLLYSSAGIDEWINIGSSNSAPTRAAYNMALNSITIKANTEKSAREAAFILAMEGKGKEALFLDTLFIHQEGRSSDYQSTDFSADGKVTQLNKATIGRGIPIVLMGDAFIDLEIADGTYMEVMNQAMENLFSEEPVKSLRDYFDVYAVTAVSSQDTPGSNYSTTFSTVPHTNDTGIDADEDKVLEYVKKVKGIDENRALAVVILNTNLHKGITYMYADSKTHTSYAVAFCPVIENLESEVFREVLVHEAIGHGLGKLADEYVNSEYGSATEKDIKTLKQHQEQFGWMLNVDSEKNEDKVLWSQFLSDSRYHAENLGVYEGGATFYKGVFRSSENSMMNSNDSPFNAPSRQVIYNKVMKLALDHEPSYNEFTDFDQAHLPATWTYKTITRQGGKQNVEIPLAPPRIIYHR